MGQKIELKKLSIRLSALKIHFKIFISVFLFVLSVGYISGLDLLNFTTNFSVEGIERNILGELENKDQDIIYFKMPKGQLNTIIHSHLIGLSIVFLILSILVNMTNCNFLFKKIFMIEPMICLITTFGGMWLLWHEINFMKYVIMISGIIMHLSFVVMVIFIYFDLFLYKSK